MFKGAGCRRELRRGRGGASFGFEMTPNSVIDNACGKLFTLPEVLNSGIVGEDERSWFVFVSRPLEVTGLLGGIGNEGRGSSALWIPESSPGTERERPVLFGLPGLRGAGSTSLSYSESKRAVGEIICWARVPGVLGKGGTSSPYEVVDDRLEWDLWKRGEADDMGEDDRVVVLGRGATGLVFDPLLVDGRGAISCTVLSFSPGAVDGRTPDNDDRDCINFVNNTPVSPTFPWLCL